MLWIVKGLYCGLQALWGPYTDKETTDEVAKRVDGIIEPWENKGNYKLINTQSTASTPG